MITTFDPDALIVGGGAIETSLDFSNGSLDRSAGLHLAMGRTRRYSDPYHAEWRYRGRSGSGARGLRFLVGDRNGPAVADWWL